ncbi:MAG: hypothetical protein MZV70_05500 [Desulfobacterales bacterium]|nr:hypothetical protein [Desulfobacterales bacterium]
MRSLSTVAIAAFSVGLCRLCRRRRARRSGRTGRPRGFRLAPHGRPRYRRQRGAFGGRDGRRRRDPEEARQERGRDGRARRVHACPRRRPRPGPAAARGFGGVGGDVRRPPAGRMRRRRRSSPSSTTWTARGAAGT